MPKRKSDVALVLVTLAGAVSAAPFSCLYSNKFPTFCQEKFTIIFRYERLLPFNKLLAYRGNR